MKTKTLILFFLAVVCSQMALANTENVADLTTTPVVQEVFPVNRMEVKVELERIQQRLNSRIERFGNQLNDDDFEWTWRGRQLNKAKRQEVCGIFQGLVDEMYQLALDNKARLQPKDQVLLANRNDFIERLGYKDNIVETKMGFDCRLR